MREPVIHSRLKERRRKRRAALVGVSFFLAAALAAGAVLVVRMPSLRIRTIAVTGSETVATTSIAGLAADDLAGDYLLVIPKDSFLFYPQAKLQADVLAAFAPLKSVTVRSDSATEISVAVSERNPAALWCGPAGAAAATTTSEADCLLMDAGGMAYAPAPQFSAPIYTPYFGTLRGGGAALPAQFLTPSTFASLSALVAALQQKANAGAVASVAVDDSGDVRMRFTDGFLLEFSILADTGTTLDHFGIALRTSPFTTTTLDRFDYLDLRFGDNLYYKLKQ